ncbi:hypothetical protein TNCV_2439131 [Trichonephila clavipes]|nr:hypothetical protein TNCV_2439131 [Trichonephila clavipes]
MNECLLMPLYKASQGQLATDFIILSLGQVMRMTPKLAHKSLNYHNRSSDATIHRRQRSTMPISVYVTLGAEVHEKMLRSGGQSEAKPPALSSQESLVLIYRSTEGMKDRVDLAQPGI